MACTAAGGPGLSIPKTETVAGGGGGGGGGRYGHCAALARAPAPHCAAQGGGPLELVARARGREREKMRRKGGTDRDELNYDMMQNDSCGVHSPYDDTK